MGHSSRQNISAFQLLIPSFSVVQEAQGTISEPVAIQKGGLNHYPQGATGAVIHTKGTILDFGSADTKMCAFSKFNIHPVSNPASSNETKERISHMSCKDFNVSNERLFSRSGSRYLS
jgi:hypothetical protein